MRKLPSAGHPGADNTDPGSRKAPLIFFIHLFCLVEIQIVISLIKSFLDFYNFSEVPGIAGNVSYFEIPSKISSSSQGSRACVFG